MRKKGIDVIEPDEIDGWANSTGFPLTYNDQLTYNRLWRRGRTKSTCRSDRKATSPSRKISSRTSTGR
jgi:hypothetical protein